MIMITGAPRTGKTTLASSMGLSLDKPVIAADAFKNVGWAEQPRVLMSQIQSLECILEGFAWCRTLPIDPRTTKYEGKYDGTRARCLLPTTLIWCRGSSENIPRYRAMTSRVIKAVEYYTKLFPAAVMEVRLV